MAEIQVTDESYSGASCSHKVKASLPVGFIVGSTIGGLRGASKALGSKVLADGEGIRIIGRKFIRWGVVCSGFMTIVTLVRC